MSINKSISSIDWTLVLIYLALIFIGWVNIYATTYNPELDSIWTLKSIAAKQLLFICGSLGLIIFIISLEAKFFERFSSLVYVGAIALLIGLFVFGKNVNGATSWYALGSFTIQPSEFAKAATALALSKYLSDIQTDIKTFIGQIKAFIIIALPALIIIPQPDPGSAIVFGAFFFPLYREGLAGIYLITLATLISIFILTLIFSPLYVITAIILITGITYYRSSKKKRQKRNYIVIALAISLFSASVSFIFNNVFEQRHRDRFNIVLGKNTDTRSVGYNTRQSKIAIGNGGWTGKGFLEGTQTQGHFVPEQETDYIFSAVGEEWGFLGSVCVILLFIALIIRIIFLSERQKNQFSRIYGYSAAGIIFVHFSINIGMVTGILPTIGIPLPFFSYGGSGLLGFTVLLFIFIKLDSNRVNEW